MLTNKVSALAIAIMLIITSSCKKDDPAPVTLKATTFTNLAADPPSGGYNPMNGQPIGVTKKYTLFSFETGAVVANADSATAKWDLGFNGTTILVNSGTSGPGTAGAQVVSGIFADITTAPETGYLSDDKTALPVFYAITKGSGNGWYNYDGATNVITPIAGKVILVRTSAGKYAKVEVISYYKDAPVSPSSTDIDRYYTFRFNYQANGTTKLE